MRQGSNNRRSRGRNNGRRSGVPNKNQTFESSGPESHIRIRGNATQVQEKYMSLARDALNSGDRILAENFFQHAEHYYRVMGTLNEAHAQAASEQQNGAQPRRGDGQDGNWQNGHDRNGRARGGDQAGEAEIVSTGNGSSTFAADPRETADDGANGRAMNGADDHQVEAKSDANGAAADMDEGEEAAAPVERQVRPRRRSASRTRRNAAQTEETSAPAGDGE
ncbi:MAG: DUF4167 domain-containing protein [Pseudomonadota bacterium]